MRDEENDQRTYQGVTSINDAVSEIRSIIETRLPTATPPAPINDFFDSADGALQNGLYYSAAITAAQGLEHEARDVAEILLGIRKRAALGQILMAIRPHMSGKTFEQIALLNRTRNTLIHETSPDSVTSEQAHELVAGFRDGVDVLRTLLL
jgi:hypothetical protein